MLRTLVLFATACACVAITHGCGDSSPEQNASPTAAAGASNSPGAGASGTQTATPPTQDAAVPVSTPAAGSGGSFAGAAAGMPANIAGAAASAGAGGGGAAPAASSERLPCEIAAVFGRQCLSCHGDPLNLGAPMRLLTWADLHAPAVTDPSKKVYELVAVRVQDTARPMPPKMNGKLAVTDRTLLVSWNDQGAPALPSSAADCP